MEHLVVMLKEVSEDYKKQAEMMRDVLKKNDIVICTVLTPCKQTKDFNRRIVKLMVKLVYRIRL